MVVVFVPRESEPGETRVSATPGTVKLMLPDGFQVGVEQGAGLVPQSETLVDATNRLHQPGLDQRLAFEITLDLHGAEPLLLSSHVGRSKQKVVPPANSGR